VSVTISSFSQISIFLLIKIGSHPF